MPTDLSTGFRLTPEDYLPTPAEVWAHFQDLPGEDGAREWLRDNDIDPDPVIAALGSVKVIRVMTSYDFDLGVRTPSGFMHDFDVKGTETLAFPVRQDGAFADLVLIDLDSPNRCGRVLHAIEWLGEEDIKGTVRLHVGPLDWLAAGCTGCCSIHPYQRAHMRALRRADAILCDDIALAMEAWEWGFGAHDDDLGKFLVDDDPGNIADYFRRQAGYGR